MSLVIWFCLAGTCKVHEIPIRTQLDPAACALYAQVKIVELAPAYQGYKVGHFGCIKGTAT